MTWAVVVSPQWACPECGGTATVQASCAADVLVPDDPPEPGDLVICIACEAISVTTPGAGLRLFVDADLAYYTLDDVARVARAVDQLRERFQRRN